jgi:chitinase
MRSSSKYCLVLLVLLISTSSHSSLADDDHHHNKHPSRASADDQVVRGGYWHCYINNFPIPLPDIPSQYFTHLFASFADVNSITYEVTFPQAYEVLFSTFTQTVQQKNPSVKTLISIGGDYATAFPSMASQSSTRKAFIDSSISLARKNNFHGLELNWLYPSTQEQMDNLGLLLQEWRAAVNQEANLTGNDPLLLVEAVSYRPQRKLLSFPFEAISTSLDWINVLGYDYYSPVPSRAVTGPFAALYNTANIYRCGDTGVQEWLQVVDAKKIAFGLPFYGYAWRLEDSTVNNGIFAPADGAADGTALGVFINPTDGTIFYNQVEYLIQTKSITTTYDEAYVVNYFNVENTWIAYNDNNSITAKVEYAKEKALLGYYAWQVAGDRNGTLARAG